VCSVSDIVCEEYHVCYVCCVVTCLHNNDLEQLLPVLKAQIAVPGGGSGGETGGLRVMLALLSIRFFN
jgi:hypothetical protein